MTSATSTMQRLIESRAGSYRITACPGCGARTFTRHDSADAAMCLRCAPVVPPRVGPGDVVARYARFYGVEPSASLDTLASLDARAVLGEAVRATLAGTPTSALLVGPTGCGKTHALLAVAAAMSDYNWVLGSDIRMGTEHELLVPRRDDFGVRSPADTFAGARMILMDEWGRGRYPRAAEGGDQFRMDFLDYVRSRNVAVVFATNLPMRGFPERYPEGDPAMWDRLSALVGPIRRFHPGAGGAMSKEHLRVGHKLLECLTWGIELQRHMAGSIRAGHPERLEHEGTACDRSVRQRQHCHACSPIASGSTR